MKITELKEKVRKLEGLYREHREAVQTIEMLRNAESGPAIHAQLAGITVQLTGEQGVEVLERHKRQLSDSIYKLSDELRVEVEDAE